MANQPTKYRKFVVGAASAALVASAVAPVASAATFTDIQGNTHEEAINALVDAGVINGYEDGTFKPNKTLTRSDVVKLMGKLLIAKGYEAPADYKTKPRFSDLKTTSNDELLKMAAVVYDNGVFVGKPDGSLDANGDITRENMAIVLVRAFDRIYDVDLVDYVKAQDFKKDVTDLGKAKAEARPAIDVLDFFDITNPAAPEFNPKNTTTRGQFASLLYKTTQVDFDKITGGTVAPGVAAVKAVNGTTVEVTFKDEVKNLNSLNFTIDGLTVANAAIKQTDNKTVVLTTAQQKGGEKYTVNLDGKAVGSFTGVQTIVPTSIKLINQSVQGQTGKQAILSADIGVKEAGVPVTFNVRPTAASTLNKQQVFEAVTNADGIATFSYTQYSDGTDEVAAYPTGNPTVRSVGYVFWGVSTGLTVEDVTAGNTIDNNGSKTYKVTFKDPKTGDPVKNASLNVSFLENLNVKIDKISKATINGAEAYQLEDDKANAKVAKITTDSKGQATFTVSGVNTKVTPVVFEGDREYKADRRQAQASTVTFAAIQATYTIEMTRNGGEIAATGISNGRKYEILVKDKDGNIAKNETVELGFNENIASNSSAPTGAYFVKENDDKSFTDLTNRTSIKTDSNGKAKFIVANNRDNTYATPIAWINLNDNKELQSNEPNTIGQISYFKTPYLDGASLKVFKGTKETSSFEGNEIATFKPELVNQSGKKFSEGGVTYSNLTYTVYNTGANDIKVDGKIVNPNRSTTVQGSAAGLNVEAADSSKSTAVRVTVNGTAKDSNNKDITFVSQEATATFASTTEVPATYTGKVVSYNEEDKEFTFAGKKAVKYEGGKNADGKEYVYEYYTVGNNVISKDKFIAELKGLREDNEVTRKVEGEKVTISIIKTGTSGSIIDAGTNQSAANKVIAAINALPAVADLKAADKAIVDKARADYNALTTAQKDLVSAAVYSKLTAAEARIAELVNTVPGFHTGEVVSYSTADKTITFAGKTPVKYEGETGVSYRYYDELNRPMSSADFLAELKQGNKVTRDVVGSTVNFYIVSKGTGAPVDSSTADITLKTVAKTLTVGDAAIKLTANDLATSTKGLTLNLTGAASSSATTVATATTSNNELVITPVAEGTANVTVNVTDGTNTKTATVAVTVKKAGATVNFNSIGASNGIQSDGLGSNLASFLKSELAADLQGTSYELKIGDKVYPFAQSSLNADRYFAVVPQAEATEAQINAGSFIVKK